MSIVHIAFYPSDWLAGTRGLSDAETGVYITLIARMYEMAGPIERDDNRLSRLCGSKSKTSFVKALEYLISEGKIVVVDGGLFNERVQKEIEKTTNKSAKAAAAAQSRWDRKTNKNNVGTHANASPKHMPQRCQSEPEPDIREDTNVSSKKITEPDGFDDFWVLWPNKVSKQRARKAWKRLSVDARRAAYRAVRDGWFERWRSSKPDANPIHPSTFLNDRRWEDEPVAQTRSQPNAKRPIAERLEARFAEMDCGEDRNPSQPLFQASHERDGGGSGHDGLDQSAVLLFPATNQRCM